MTDKTETCANCGATIGRLETAHLWQEQVVCGKCIERLLDAPTAKVKELHEQLAKTEDALRQAMAEDKRLRAKPKPQKKEAYGAHNKIVTIEQYNFEIMPEEKMNTDASAENTTRVNRFMRWPGIWFVLWFAASLVIFGMVAAVLIGLAPRVLGGPLDVYSIGIIWVGVFVASHYNAAWWTKPIEEGQGNERSKD